mmetsp:Transcript_99403/g.136650  ORF Transcript_99403/g.136650 Transcript_99403/m.136650 type:complete len:154 (-) Transcript_99403:620-1081(-)
MTPCEQSERHVDTAIVGQLETGEFLNREPFSANRGVNTLSHWGATQDVFEEATVRDWKISSGRLLCVAEALEGMGSPPSADEVQDDSLVDATSTIDPSAHHLRVPTIVHLRRRWWEESMEPPHQHRGCHWRRIRPRWLANARSIVNFNERLDR